MVPPGHRRFVKRGSPHPTLVGQFTALVVSGAGPVPGEPGWSCRIAPLRNGEGGERSGAASIALSFSLEDAPPDLALVGVCCWDEAASCSVWRFAERMMKSFPMRGASVPDVAPLRMPWLATMQMPLGRRVAAFEMAAGLDCMCAIVWAQIDHYGAGRPTPDADVV